MIKPEIFLNALRINKINFITGVPDSMFESLCFCFEINCKPEEHITAANEGSGIGIAIGYHLSTGKIPLVYMQNSGLGNALNPIVSLASKQIYKIPIILLIGWRGEIKNNVQIKDEPQHLHQGKITEKLLKLLGINFTKINVNSDVKNVVKKMKKLAQKKSMPVAILIRKNTFLKTKIKKNFQKKLTREQALKKICQYIPNKIPKISTTGMLSRELYELNKKNKNPHNTFMCVGGMGHAISIATGLAKAKKKIKVFCLDGDGSSLMHMGSMVSSAKCKNLIHIVFNNNSHDSVGGQKTAANNLKFKKVALALGYSEVFSISNEKEISKVIKLCLKNRNSSFIEINCQSGHRKNLIRPIETPEFNKKKFVQFIKKNYG